MNHFNLVVLLTVMIAAGCAGPREVEQRSVSTPPSGSKSVSTPPSSAKTEAEQRYAAAKASYERAERAYRAEQTGVKRVMSGSLISMAIGAAVAHRVGTSRASMLSQQIDQSESMLETQSQKVDLAEQKMKAARIEMESAKAAMDQSELASQPPRPTSSGAQGGRAGSAKSVGLAQTTAKDCESYVPPRCASAQQKGIGMLEELSKGRLGINSLLNQQYCALLIGLEVNDFCAAQERAAGRPQCAELWEEQNAEYRRTMPVVQAAIEDTALDSIRQACSWE